MKKSTASPFTELPAFITAKEAARVLRLGMTRLYSLVNEGRIPHTRFGNIGNKGNAQIMVSVAGLKKVMFEAVGASPDLDTAILGAINSPDVKRRRGRPAKKETRNKPVLAAVSTPKRTGGFGSTTNLDMTSGEKPHAGEIPMEENVLIEYAKIFRLFLSSAIELQTFKNGAIARAIDALEAPEGDIQHRLTPDERPIRKTFGQLRAVYKKLGRKVTFLYSKLPVEIKPVLKDPTEIKKSLLSNLIYREDLNRHTDWMISIPYQKDTSCDKIISNLIETGFFGQDRDFGSILAEVLKTELICSDKRIRRALKKAVISGKVNACGYGKGTKYVQGKAQQLSPSG